MDRRTVEKMLEAADYIRGGKDQDCHPTPWIIVDERTGRGSILAMFADEAEMRRELWRRRVDAACSVSETGNEQRPPERSEGRESPRP